MSARSSLVRSLAWTGGLNSLKMFRPLTFLALLAAVLGEGVVLESQYGNEDMAAQATIVREGFVYPGGQIGYGGSGYSYSAKTPLYGSLGAPYIGASAGSLGLGGQVYYPPPPQYYGGAGQDIGLESIKYLSGGAGGLSLPPPSLYQPKYSGVSHLSYAPIAPIAPIGYGGEGGEYVDKSVYDQGKKQLKDLQFQNSHGRKGEEFQHGQQGFQQGQQALKDVKADSGYYSGEEAAKKLAEDAKHYYGNRHYNQEGRMLGRLFYY